MDPTASSSLSQNLPPLFEELFKRDTDYSLTSDNSNLDDLPLPPLPLSMESLQPQAIGNQLLSEESGFRSERNISVEQSLSLCTASQLIDIITGYLESDNMLKSSSHFKSALDRVLQHLITRLSTVTSYNPIEKNSIINISLETLIKITSLFVERNIRCNKLEQELRNRFLHDRTHFQNLPYQVLVMHIASLSDTAENDAQISALVSSTFLRHDPRTMSTISPPVFGKLLRFFAGTHSDEVNRLFSFFEENHCNQESLKSFTAKELIHLVDSFNKQGRQSRNTFIAIQEAFLLPNDSPEQNKWRALDIKTQCDTLYIFRQFGVVNPSLFDLTTSLQSEIGESLEYSRYVKIAIAALKCGIQSPALFCIIETKLVSLPNNPPDELFLELLICYLTSNTRETHKVILSFFQDEAIPLLSATTPTELSQIVVHSCKKGSGSPEFFDAIYRQLTDIPPNDLSKIQKLSRDDLLTTIHAICSHPQCLTGELYTIFAALLCHANTLSTVPGPMLADFIAAFSPYKASHPELFAQFGDALNALDQESGQTKFQKMSYTNRWRSIVGLRGAPNDAFQQLKNIPPLISELSAEALQHILLFMSTHAIQDQPFFLALYNELIKVDGAAAAKFSQLERLQSVKIFEILVRQVADCTALIPIFIEKFLKNETADQYDLQDIAPIQLFVIANAYNKSGVKNKNFLLAIKNELLQPDIAAGTLHKALSLTPGVLCTLAYIFVKEDLLCNSFYTMFIQPVGRNIYALNAQTLGHLAISLFKTPYPKSFDLTHHLEVALRLADYSTEQGLLTEMLSAFADKAPSPLLFYNLPEFFSDRIQIQTLVPKVLAQVIADFLKIRIAYPFSLRLKDTFLEGATKNSSKFDQLHIEEALTFVQRTAYHPQFKQKGFYSHFLRAVTPHHKTEPTRLCQAETGSLLDLILTFSAQKVPYTRLLKHLAAAFLQRDANGKTKIENGADLEKLLKVMEIFSDAEYENKALWKAFGRAFLPYGIEGFSRLIRKNTIALKPRLLALYALIDSGFPPNLVRANKDTALIIAIKAKKPSIAKKLLERGAQVNKRGAGGHTPLYHACTTGNTKIATLLINEYHAFIDAHENCPFQEALEDAPWTDNPEKMKEFFGGFFIDFPAAIAHINPPNGYKDLIEHMTNYPELIVNSACIDPDCNPLEFAHLLQDENLTVAIIDKIVEVMDKDRLKEFFTKLANKYPELSKSVPLAIFSWACEHRDTAFLLKIIDTYPKAIHFSDTEGCRYLHMAAWDDVKHSVVKKLLELKADINAVDINGNTAIHHACNDFQSGNTELLLSYGADISRKNSKELAPFHYALFDSDGRLTIDLQKIVHFFERFFKDQPTFLDSIRQIPASIVARLNFPIQAFAANKSANPLMPAFLLNDRKLAEQLIPLLTGEEFDRSLQNIQQKYPRLSIELLKDARYAVNQETMRASAVESDIPPKVAGITLQELMPFFDEINFTQSQGANYCDPQPLYDELKVKSVPELRAALENGFIKKVNERWQLVGTAKKGTPGLIAFYNAIESAITHIITKCKTMDNSVDNKKKKSDLIIEFLKTNGKCGARIHNVTRTQYNLIVKNKAQTIDNCLSRNLGELRSILLESLVPPRIDETNALDYNIHDSGLLLKRFGRAFNIPNAAMFEAFNDDYGDRKLDEKAIKEQFFDAYTPSAIILELQQQFQHDEEFREHTIDFWKTHVPQTWKSQEHMALMDEAVKLYIDNALGWQAALQQFARDNFLTVKGAITLDTIKAAIDDVRGQEHLGEEVIDMTAQPMQIKREKLIEMLIQLRVLEVRPFKSPGVAPGAGGAGGSR